MTPGASGTAAVNEPRHVPGSALAKTKEVRKDPSYPQPRRSNQPELGGSVLLEKPGSIMGGKQQPMGTRNSLANTGGGGNAVFASASCGLLFIGDLTALFEVQDSPTCHVPEGSERLTVAKIGSRIQCQADEPERPLSRQITFDAPPVPQEGHLSSQGWWQPGGTTSIGSMRNLRVALGSHH